MDCVISYNSNGVNYSATLKSFGGGIVEIEMLSPAFVKGLKYTYDNGKGELSFLGLKVPIENIDSGILKEIAEVTLNIYSGNLSPIRQKEGYAINLNGIAINFDEEGFITGLKTNDILVNFEHKK